jgi:hypothetical protein
VQGDRFLERGSGVELLVLAVVAGEVLGHLQESIRGHEKDRSA